LRRFIQIFFFYEHCSHFTVKTLSSLADTIDLSVLCRLESILAPVEIGLLCGTNIDHLGSSLDLASLLLEKIPTLCNNKPLGVFGVGGVGMYLGSNLNMFVDFFVDDDPLKQSKSLYDIPIISLDQVPENSLVIVAFNNPELSFQMRNILLSRRPELEFICLPDHSE